MGKVIKGSFGVPPEPEFEPGDEVELVCDACGHDEFYEDETVADHIICVRCKNHIFFKRLGNTTGD